MAGQYFGTDGIRGRANKFPMTAEVAMRVVLHHLGELTASGVAQLCATAAHWGGGRD